MRSNLPPRVQIYGRRLNGAIGVRVPFPDIRERMAGLQPRSLRRVLMHAILTCEMAEAKFIGRPWKRHFYDVDVRATAATNQYPSLLVPTAAVLRKSVEGLAKRGFNEDVERPLWPYQVQHSKGIFPNG